MKHFFLTLFLSCIVSSIFAQWTSSGGITTTSDYIGVGLSNPLQRFVIKSSGLNTGSSSTDYDFGITDGASYPLQLLSLVNTNKQYGLIQVIQGGIGARNLVLQSGGGNVGIGTTTPGTALQIGDFNSGSSNNQLLIPGVYNFEQIKLGQIGNGNSALEFVNHNSLTNSYGIKLSVDVDQVPGLQFQYATSTTSYAALNYVTGLFMNLSGNVGIGTTAPGTYRLAVNGGIHSQSVNVDLTGWSDYVFNQNYKLPSLTEVKSYIDQNHHLPDMPSEQEVIKDGINLGEMNKLLTKKVEELTLYLIAQKEEQEKTQKQQQAKINQLEAALQQLLKSK